MGVFSFLRAPSLIQIEGLFFWLVGFGLGFFACYIVLMIMLFIGWMNWQSEFSLGVSNAMMCLGGVKIGRKALGLNLAGPQESRLRP